MACRSFHPLQASILGELCDAFLLMKDVKSDSTRLDCDLPGSAMMFVFRTIW